MTPDFAKATSHAFLRQHSIEISEALPLIGTMEELNPSDARSVATRSVVLSYVVGIGFGVNARRLRASLEQFSLCENASAHERNLMSKEHHTQQEKIDAIWLTECIQSLAWCLGLVELNPFNRCDDDLASRLPPPFTDPSRFISEATLRPMGEIYLQADLHYRLHWVARNARLTGRQSPVDEGLISERRKALDWVIGVEKDWDEIPLDT